MAEEVTDSTTPDAAAETSGDSATTPPPSEPATDSGDEAALGDAGKKALDSMKAKWKDADKLAKENAAKIAELQAKIDGTEAEHAKAQEDQRIKDEALAAANQRILKAELRAAAAGKLNDPADALAYIDLASFEVGEDGAVDSDAIGSAISDLISKKPYLAAQGGRFQGSADGGARKDATTPTQLTAADVKRLSDEGRHEEIVKAQSEGRLNDLFGTK